MYVVRKSVCNALICLGLILGVGGTSVYAHTQVSVENHFSTGVVDIELEEYTLQHGKEVPWENNINCVLPGQDIYKTPRIINEGNDCYVRANVRFMNALLSVDSFYGMPDSWILAPDGYYYYTDVLLSGESVDLFEGFKLPEDFEQNMEESMFELQIQVDAVQSDHFTPNYSLDHPWGNIEIQNCTKEDMYELSTFKQKDYLTFCITYEGKSKRLITNEEDFFKNFPVLLPGDIYEEQLEFSNDSEEPVNLYFRTKALDGTELLDKVMLKIKKNIYGEEEVIYEGPIRATDLAENILLGTVQSGESGCMIYEIYVPESLDNEYTLMEDEVVWIFSTEPVAEIDAVPTGDHTIHMSLIMLCSGFILIMLAMGMRLYEKARMRNGQ